MADNEREVSLTIAAKNFSAAGFNAAAGDLQQFKGHALSVSQQLTSGMSAAGAAASSSGQMISGMSSSGVAEMQRLTESTEAPGLSFGQLAQGIAGAAGVVTGLAAGVAALGERGAGVADVRQSFVDLTGSIGESSDVMLGKLRTATLGNVSDFELMKTVNVGLSQGLKLTADQMGLTGDIAAVLADRVGGDVGEAFDVLTMAMSTGQDRQLKTIGLNIDAAKATADYATQIGKSVKDLDEAEKKQAIVNAILAEGQNVLDLSGTAQVDFGDRVNQSRVQLSNFVDGISEWVATSPSIGAWSSVITGAASTVTALGFAWGPTSAGVSKLIPLLGVSGGLTGALAGVATAAAPVTAAIAGIAATATIGYQAWQLCPRAAARAASDVKQTAVDVANLERINKATGKSFETIAEAAAYVREQAQKAGAAGFQFGQQMASAAQAATPPTKTLGSMVAAVEDELRAMSATTKRDLVGALKQGALSMEDLEKETGLSSSALRLFKQRQDDATAANKKATEEIQKLRDAEEKAALKMTEMGWATRDTTARMNDIARIGQQTTIPTINDMATAAERYGQKVQTGTDAMKSLQDMVDELPDHVPAMQESVRLAGEEFDNSITNKITVQVKDALGRMPQIFIDAFTGGGGVIGALKGIGVDLLNAVMSDILKPLWDQVADWASGIAAKIAGAFASGGVSMPSVPGMGGIGGGGIGLAAGIGLGAIGLMGGIFVNDLIDGSTGTTAPSGWINGVYVEPTYLDEAQAAPPQNNYLGSHGPYAYMPYEFAGGTGGQFMDFGAGTPAILHGEERVVTKSEGLSTAAMNEALRASMDAMSANIVREIRSLGPSMTRSLTAALLAAR